MTPVLENRASVAVRSQAKVHAERLRFFTEKSNAVHRQYLSDADLFDKYERFLEWQIAYSLPFYSEFDENAETAAAVEFVVSDLIGTGVSARDADMARVVPVMVRLLPAKALKALAAAMELNFRALAINLDVCRQLYAAVDVAAGCSERQYCEAFRTTTSLDECMDLINLTTDLGHALKGLVRSTFLQATLRAMHYPAHAAGFGAMQQFLEKGFTTFHAIDDVDEFLDRFRTRMMYVFTRTCAEPLDVLDAAAWRVSAAAS
ncbi:MAG: hypothetical protein QNJ14_14440 [Woeseiaceae bacterium]|nr:hypothetical protein [Woeseiaceae bacterium]